MATTSTKYTEITEEFKSAATTGEASSSTSSSSSSSSSSAPANNEVVITLRELTGAIEELNKLASNSAASSNSAVFTSAAAASATSASAASDSNAASSTDVIPDCILSKAISDHKNKPVVLDASKITGLNLGGLLLLARIIASSSSVVEVDLSDTHPLEKQEGYINQLQGKTSTLNITEHWVNVALILAQSPSLKIFKFNEAYIGSGPEPWLAFTSALGQSKSLKQIEMASNYFEAQTSGFVFNVLDNLTKNMLVNKIDIQDNELTVDSKNEINQFKKARIAERERDNNQLLSLLSTLVYLESAAVPTAVIKLMGDYCMEPFATEIIFETGV